MTKAVRKRLFGSFIQLPYPHLVTLLLLLLSGQQLINPPCTCHSHWHMGQVEGFEYLMVVHVFESKSAFLQLLESELEACHC